VRPLVHIGLAVLLLAALAGLPGCARNAARPAEAPGIEERPAPSADATAGEAGTVAAEAEVKPAPEKEPPAAAPPAMLPLEVPEPGEPTRTASPEEQTKQALEPKAIHTASLPQPRSEPTAKPTPPAAEETRTLEAQPAKPKAGQASAPERSIAVVGDSLAVGIGMTMAERMNQYVGVGCHPLGKVSTGLISKKFFDWEKRLTELVATEKLAAVVVMMGGNDANNPIAGKAAGTPEWGEAYRQKAESFLRIAEGAGIKVLWVGLPAMREAAYNDRVRAVNAAAKAACAKVGGCVYMEASDIFTDASGNYVQAKDIGGKTVTLRGKDGVHMTMTGYDLLCRQVLEKLSAAGALSSGK